MRRSDTSSASRSPHGCDQSTSSSRTCGLSPLQLNPILVVLKIYFGDGILPKRGVSRYNAWRCLVVLVVRVALAAWSVLGLLVSVCQVMTMGGFFASRGSMSTMGAISLYQRVWIISAIEVFRAVFVDHSRQMCCRG
ncbi:hypothetical protein GDO81_021111 [Engystomops pustulosus]|uniref:Uncharacterized protein n=1 Tax=Engystomops pustulosus TaxID=76066 RepID=A0AAV6YVX6_ENGPU|nr:hypothetical protein GDO81_021111 [Engystomops pustulosus]